MRGAVRLVLFLVLVVVFAVQGDADVFLLVFG